MSEDGRAFLDELGRYLDTFGYRSDLFDPMTPTWRENPLIPLSTVRSYLINRFDANADHAAKARAADEALNAARGRLASYPEPVRQQFEAMVQAARTAAQLQEDHNFYIDQHSVAWTRLLFLQVGKRLVSMPECWSRRTISSCSGSRRSAISWAARSTTRAANRPGRWSPSAAPGWSTR